MNDSMSQNDLVLSHSAAPGFPDGKLPLDSRLGASQLSVNFPRKILFAPLLPIMKTGESSQHRILLGLKCFITLVISITSVVRPKDHIGGTDRGKRISEKTVCAVLKV